MCANKLDRCDFAESLEARLDWERDADETRPLGGMHVI